MDHKVFDDDIKKVTLHAGCLSIICETSRWVKFAPVKTLGALDAARVFYTEWVALFGVPAQIRSDKGSAFIASLMQAVAQILGIKSHDFACAHEPTHHALVEKLSRNNVTTNTPIANMDTRHLNWSLVKSRVINTTS